MKSTPKTWTESFDSSNIDNINTNNSINIDNINTNDKIQLFDTFMKSKEDFSLSATT